MPAPSPNNITSLSIRCTITVNRAVIKDEIGITSVYIRHEINKISYAEIVLTGEIDIQDSSMAATDGTDFSVGQSIKVSAGYGDDAETSLFEGIIVKHGIEIDSGTAYSLKLTCKHKAVNLTFNQKEEEFQNKTDSAIISSIFSTHGLSCTVESTTAVHENFLQKLATDWDIVLSRAEFNGYIVLTDEGKITIGKPSFSSSPVLRLALGDSILAFQAELNTEVQSATVEALSWDSKTQALLKSVSTEPQLNAQGNLPAKDLPEASSQEKITLHAGIGMSTEELKTWADGRLLKMRLNAIKGTVEFIGNASVKTGNLVTLEGVGKKFNGDAFVSAVTHTIEDGYWKTTVGFGLDDSPVAAHSDFSYRPANGQLPAIRGLQVATVKKLAEDPQSAYRILVTLPSAAQNNSGVWARMANFYATSTSGLGFLPEPGDEVVLGFLDDDPRFPIILGSLYSTKNQAPNPALDENNYIKSITTKSKLKISFDDENKIIRIESPGLNMITISDKDQSIEIDDQNKNKLKMSADGISLNSPKDIIIDTKGNLKLSATSNITIASGTGDVELTGNNIKQTAKIGFTAKGNATAEVSASGQTTIKGAMVMIN